MKSSTLRRANLSREKMQVLENLASYKRQQISHSALSANKESQSQQIKERELDVLWNNFKQHAGQDKSPTVYLITGFIAGIIVMTIITIVLHLSVNSINTPSDITDKVPNTKVEDTAITFIPADKEDSNSQKVANSTSGQETYTVQSGDTLENIIIRFYGSYSKDRELAIKNINHMKNPNALSIGQKLIIPLN
ncbi:LysM peptidoglycan-binding domain-containing protein [bacterium]|nr:LysM peptidoglycan-binding domain-containing protein [bacterium]